jgi:hypothetical protein
MENSPNMVSPSIARCEGCYREVGNDDIYCTHCGYPIKGSASEQKAFISREIKAGFDKVAFKNRINKAGNMLFYLSGIFALTGIISFFGMRDNPDILAVVVPNIILAVLFLLLGEYSRKKTLAAFISGLCLSIIFLIINIIETARIDLFYIIFIPVVVVFLIMGIKSAIEIEKIKKEHNIA